MLRQFAVHDYTNERCYWLIQIHRGVYLSLRFVILAIPKMSMETDYYVKEPLIFVKSLIPIETILLDRGFYTWGVIKVLKELKLRYWFRNTRSSRLKKGVGLHEHRGYCTGTKCEISTYIAGL